MYCNRMFYKYFIFYDATVALPLIEILKNMFITKVVHVCVYICV